MKAPPAAHKRASVSYGVCVSCTCGWRSSTWYGKGASAYAHGELHGHVEKCERDQRDIETLDMTPEGYVREWDKRGRKTGYPASPWEQAYQNAGLIEAASKVGYIWIGRNAACTVTITPKGEELLRKE